MQTHSHKIHKIHFDSIAPAPVALQVSKIEALINQSRLPAFGVAIDLVRGLNTEFFSNASGTRPRPN